MGIADEAKSAAAARQEYREFFALLDRLSLETPQVLARSAASGGQVQQLTASVTEIRGLLTELSRLGAGQRLLALPSGTCEELAERFLSLEGLIKELRNDLARSREPEAEERV